MSRTLHYYNAYLTKNGQKTDLYFTELLDKIRLIDWPDRLRKINETPMALFDAKIPGNSLNRIIAIGKYRHDIKPYVGDIAFEKADFIKQDIIEMVTCLAIPQNKTIIMEYNTYGSKVKDLEEYFNSFLPEGPDKWRIEFEPIDSERSLRDVQESTDIRRVEIRLNLHAGLCNRFEESLIEVPKPKSLLGAIFSSAEVVKERLDASVVTLSFGKGRTKEDMNASEVIKLIEVLDLENDLIQSLKVRYCNAKTGKIEDLDLKYVGILKDSLEIDNPEAAWEFLGDKMLELYNKKDRPGSTAFTKRGYSFIPVRFPSIVNTPNDKYKVEVVQGYRKERVS